MGTVGRGGTKGCLGKEPAPPESRRTNVWVTRLRGLDALCAGAGDRQASSSWWALQRGPGSSSLELKEPPCYCGPVVRVVFQPRGVGSPLLLNLVGDVRAPWVTEAGWRVSQAEETVAWALEVGEAGGPLQG